MSLKNPWILFGALIITIPGTVADGLQVTQLLTGEVTYTSQRICALKGASVDLTCSYTPPTNQTVSSVFWFNKQQTHSWWNKEQPEDLLLDSEYMGRLKYTTKGRSSTLTITDLRLTDSGVYHCLLISDQERYTDSAGVNITVTDLQIKVVGTAPVDLSCTTLCNLEFKMLKVPPENKFLYFNIYKNGQYKNYTFPNKPTLRLSRDDGGSYSCAVGGLDHLRSAAVCVLSDRCWNVSYSEMRICALGGSSVQLSSSYTYPKDHILTSTFWHQKPKGPNDLRNMEAFKGRSNYVKIKQDHSNLLIQDVSKTDAEEYCLRVTTQTSFSGMPGVILNVTDLEVKMPANTVPEGQAVVLTCSTTCSLSSYTSYIWYRNGQPVTSRHTSRNKLYLTSLSREDGGQYSCAVKGHEKLASSAVTLYISHIGKRKPPTQWNEEASKTVTYASAGLIISLITLLICGGVWIWRRRRSSSNSLQKTETIGEKGQVPPRPACSNDSAREADMDDENDIQYSSIQFHHPNQQTNKPTQREDSDVLYASVRVH